MKLKLFSAISVVPLLLSISTATLSAGMNYADVKLTHLQPTTDEMVWVREKQFTPAYPKKLAMKGIAGCGVFKVSVDEKGKTKNVELIASVPKKVIYKPARKVIKSWNWKNISDKPNVAEEKIIRLDFCMGGKSQAEAKQMCEQQAKFACSA